ncbi:MAG TPA: sulfurtransferase TusA family protein [Pseudomonadales bacterium]|jgi:TusA-related sulfurtransferase
MQELDARGMQCPMPLLKAKQALNRMAPGERLRVLATDAGSLRDFQVFCQQSGHVLESQCTEAGIHTHVLRKKQE